MAWKDGFIRDVFPVLCGERPLTSVSCVSGITGVSGVNVGSAGEACACGRRRKDECCEVKETSTSTTPSQDAEVSTS